MRILMGHNLYQTPGGEDTVARAEAELLRSYGEEVLEYQRHNDEFTRLNPASKISQLMSFGFNRTSYNEMRKVLRQFRPQVAHFHNIYYMLTPAVYRACRDENVPVVQSLHNFRMMCSNGLFYRHGHVCEDCVTKNLWEGVKHRCFRNSAIMTAVMASTLEGFWRKGVWLNDVDRFIVAAEFTRRKYVDRGIPVEKIVLKPHFMHPDPGRRHHDLGYVLYLGRLSQEKGVDVLLKAWRDLKTIPLKIAGSGLLESSLRDLVRKQNLSSVEFMGFQDQGEGQKLLAHARAIVVPSVCYENFPRVIVEAFAHGVPVLASRIGSLAELIEDGRTGVLVNPGDPADLERAVRWCFENPLKTLQMGDNARRVFEERYSARNNYEKLMEIYRDVSRKVSK